MWKVVPWYGHLTMLKSIFFKFLYKSLDIEINKVYLL